MKAVVVDSLRRGLFQLVLDETVRPGNANRVDRFLACQTEMDRHPVVIVFLVKQAGLDFDLGAYRLSADPNSLEPDPNPAVRGLSGIGQSFQLSLRVEQNQVEPAVPVEVRCGAMLEATGL